MSAEYALEWACNMGLTWSGRWHVINFDAPSQHSPRREQALSLCGSYIYLREGIPARNKRLNDIASGKVTVPICKKCAKKVNGWGE